MIVLIMRMLLFRILCYLFANNLYFSPDQPSFGYIAVLEKNINPIYNVLGEDIRIAPSVITEKKQPFGGQKSAIAAIPPQNRLIKFFVFFFAIFLILNTLIMVLYVCRLKQQIYLMDQKFAALLQHPTKPTIRQNENPKTQRYLLIKPGKNQSETPEESSMTLYNQIIGLIDKEKLFLDPNLDQQLISKKLATNKTYIYEAIHRHSTLNFKGLINHLRVEEAQRIIQQLILEKKDLNYEMIIQLSGFNSRTSFYRIFKANVGLSPKEFEDKIRAQRSM